MSIINKKPYLKGQIERLEQEINDLRKEHGSLIRAADLAEGFLSKVALMPELDAEIRGGALKHSEGLRASIKMML